MTHQISSGLTSHDFVGEECVLSVVMTNILTKHNLQIIVHHWGKSTKNSSKNLKVGTITILYSVPPTQALTSQPHEVWKKPQRMLLVTWLTGWLTFFWLSSIVEDHLLREGATHNGLGTPTSINNQDNLPKICYQASLTKAIPQLKFLSQKTLSCVELILKAN